MNASAKVSEILPKGRKSFLRTANTFPTERNQPTLEQREQLNLWFDRFFLSVMAAVSAGGMLRNDKPMEQATRKAWLLAFSEAGIIKHEQVHQGLERLRAQRRKWMPSAHEFLDLCQPSHAEYGLPEPDAAYHEALEKMPLRRMGQVVEWSHEAVRVAAGRVAMLLCEGTEAQSKSAFQREYQRAFDLVKAGKLASDVQALPQKEIDPNLAQYQRLLASHGEGVANDFLASCAEHGVNIYPESGATTYPKAKTNGAERVESLITLVSGVGTDTPQARHDPGLMPEYHLPDNDQTRKNREMAHKPLELVEENGGAS